MWFNRFNWTNRKSSMKVFFFVSATLLLLILFSVTGKLNANGAPQQLLPSLDDPLYKDKMAKWQLNWLIYALLDEQFRVKLFQNPKAISTELGLDAKQAAGLEKIVTGHKSQLENNLNEMIVILGLCDRWPCPPIDQKLPKDQ